MACGALAVIFFAVRTPVTVTLPDYTTTIVCSIVSGMGWVWDFTGGHRYLLVPLWFQSSIWWLLVARAGCPDEELCATSTARPCCLLRDGSTFVLPLAATRTMPVARIASTSDDLKLRRVAMQQKRNGFYRGSVLYKTTVVALGTII